MYRGYKIKKDEYTLEVENIENVGLDIYSVKYVVKKGHEELVSGVVFVTRENYSRVLKDTLNEIVRGVKRVENLIRRNFSNLGGV